MNYSGNLRDNEGNVFYPKTVTQITTGEEFETGRIIDGNKEYGKQFSPIALPSSAGNVTISTGLGNVNFIKLEGAILKDGGTLNTNLPYMYTGSESVYHYYNNSSKTITIRATGDMSSYKVVETIYYTKN